MQALRAGLNTLSVHMRPPGLSLPTSGIGGIWRTVRPHPLLLLLQKAFFVSVGMA